MNFLSPNLFCISAISSLASFNEYPFIPLYRGNPLSNLFSLIATILLAYISVFNSAIDLLFNPLNIFSSASLNLSLAHPEAPALFINKL